MKTTALCILSLLFAFSALAQTGPAKPTAEHKRLEVWAGNWKYTETSVETPFGPAGKGAYTSDAQVILGGLCVEEKGKGTAPTGPYSWLWIATYDPDQGSYIALTFDTDVATKPWKNECGKGKVEGNTWSWTWKQDLKGKTYQCRSVSVVAPDGRSYTYEWSYSEDGSTWKPWLKGQATKGRSGPRG